MLKHRWLVWVGVLGVLLPAAAMAQQPFRWHPTLESAKREAAQSGRLVLVHFWADWCHACKKMERDVFTRPDVAGAVLFLVSEPAGFITGEVTEINGGAWFK